MKSTSDDSGKATVSGQTGHGRDDMTPHIGDRMRSSRFHQGNTTRNHEPSVSHE